MNIKLTKKIIRTGNSLGVTIPRNILIAMGVDPTKDKLELDIKKAKRRMI